MKIDIHQEPRADIFKDQPGYARLFVFFLALAALGLLLGVYAYFNPDSPMYEILEQVSMVLFAGSSIPIFITGQKLQAYKMLTESQEKDLERYCRQYDEVRNFRDRVAALDRRMILAEFDACRDYAEERELRDAREKKVQEKQQS